MSTKLFTVTIHYRDYNAVDRETHLENITEADINARCGSIYKSGVKIRLGPLFWEVVPPARISKVFIEQQIEL